LLQLYKQSHEIIFNNTPKDNSSGNPSGPDALLCSICDIAPKASSSVKSHVSIIFSALEFAVTVKSHVSHSEVKFFHWIANIDRCWTADRLARRGLQHHPKCLLCDQEAETIHHLFIGFPFSRQIWHEILSWLRMSCRPPLDDASLNAWWTVARQHTPKPMRKGLATITLMVPWMIWKHRNSCVFDGQQPSIRSLCATIKDEAAAWATAGAKGLRDVLPTTWDVH
jgi:hypothetical protein